jgi:hypothetical protein
MILWNTGLVETITPAVLGSRATWRITHYSQDPVGDPNDYDLYDVDRSTFAPLRSVMNNAELHLELTFTDKHVTLRNGVGRDAVTEEIPLSAPVQPEGPGLDVFVARLPLTPGYKMHYEVVDRWGGHGSTRVKAVTLSVSNRVNKETTLGKRDILQVLIKPDDSTYQINEEVLADGLHFPVRVEYTREGKTHPPSEVISVTDSME